MAKFIRIKHYVINLDTLTYVRVDQDHIDFGFAFPTEKPGGQNYVRLERGTDLQDSEFEEVREFVLQLPDPDRVVVPLRPSVSMQVRVGGSGTSDGKAGTHRQACRQEKCVPLQLRFSGRIKMYNVRGKS